MTLLTVVFRQQFFRWQAGARQSPVTRPKPEETSDHALMVLFEYINIIKETSILY